MPAMTGQGWPMAWLAMAGQSRGHGRPWPRPWLAMAGPSMIIDEVLENLRDRYLKWECHELHNGHQEPVKMWNLDQLAIDWAKVQQNKNANKKDADNQAQLVQLEQKWVHLERKQQETEKALNRQHAHCEGEMMSIPGPPSTQGRHPPNFSAA